MNGLATDLQMFALKTLKIPLPGRHPPSPAPGPQDEPAKSGYFSCTHFSFFSLSIAIFKCFCKEKFAISSIIYLTITIYLPSLICYCSMLCIL